MTQPRLRLLYSSNSFNCTSGYGVQGRSLLPRLAELPEFGAGGSEWVDDGFFRFQVPSGRRNIGAFFWYGYQGAKNMVGGFDVYPAGNDPYGNDVIGPYTKHYGANVVIPLIDAWVLRDVARAVSPALFCPWLPIDHLEVPQRVLDSIAGAHLPLTYSEWGHETLTKAGVNNYFVPHGLEPSIYNVIPREDALAFKRAVTGVENAHLSVVVAANKGVPARKWHEGQVEAWRDFAKDKPDAFLYYHTEPTQIYGGVDFGWLMDSLGVATRVRFPDRLENFLGLPPQYLNLVYNAADVLMSCSMSEGFGIPIIEAQAAGAPVVVTDFSAMPELVHWGYKVKVNHLVPTPMNAHQAWPDMADMTAKLNILYDAWLISGGDWPLAQRLKTSESIHAKYSWDKLVEQYWAPLMTRLADEAPPLDERFRVTVPSAYQSDVESFVEAINSELKPKPKKRVAPLTKAAA